MRAVKWTVLSREQDDDGETTTWLVDFRKPQEQAPARDDDRAEGDDKARTDEGRD